MVSVVFALWHKLSRLRLDALFMTGSDMGRIFGDLGHMVLESSERKHYTRVFVKESKVKGRKELGLT